MICDSIRGKCCSELSRAFCKAYALNTTFTLSLRKYHDQNVAQQLACAWCHRMQFIFELWKASDDEDYIFDPEEIDLYTEHPAYLETVRHVPVEDIAWDRVLQIRQIKPCAPIWK